MSISLLLPFAHAQSVGQELSPDSRVPVFKSGPGITPPALTPVDLSSLISTSCRHKFSGRVELSLVIDAKGVPQNIMFLKPAVTDADRLAVIVASMDRFTPATNAGTPVAIGRSIEMKLDACVVQTTRDGQDREFLKLRDEPVQKIKSFDGYPPEVVFANPIFPANPRSAPAGRIAKVGEHVFRPVAIATPEAQYSEVARRKRIQGKCMISVFVDTFGLPRDAIVVDSLEPTLDEKALEAVYRYRFKPAIRNNVEPVPVMITVEVNFRLY